jgi:glycosyltransferase involved in cell wall biosynthesis
MSSLDASKIFVTVLMSCYNAERWLDSSVLSVLNQTFTNFEFIIIDDGSTDGTLKKLNEFAAIDSRIVVLSKTNTGLSDSLNVGISMAKGNWIARIDADDIFEPIKLEKQVGEIDKNSNLVFIGTGLTIIDEFGRKLKVYSYPENHLALQKNLRTARKFPPHASAMYKSSVIRKLGGYRGRISKAEDADLWLRFSEVGEMACLAGSYVQIRKHSGQISHAENGTRQMLDARLATVASWLRHFGYPDPIAANDKDYENYKSWIVMQLNENRLFEFLAHKEKIQLILGATSTNPFNLFNLFKLSLIRPIHSIRYIKEKMNGETLPQRLAIKWINQQKKVGL